MILVSKIQEELIRIDTGGFATLLNLGQERRFSETCHTMEAYYLSKYEEEMSHQQNSCCLYTREIRLCLE